MRTHVAFLRSINVGGRRVTGAALEAAFDAIGLESPASYQASGNVAFDAPGADVAALRTRIEEGLRSALDFDVPTMVRTGAEVAAAASLTPFSDAELAASRGKVQVSLLMDVPDDDAVGDVLALATDDDRLHVEGRELYWLPAAGMSDADLDVAVIERLLGMQTRRTQATLQRLVAKFDLAN